MPLANGDRLGRYEILASIGAGGMGEVYHATDSILGREVALKTLPEEMSSDKDRLARFYREATRLRRATEYISSQWSSLMASR